MICLTSIIASACSPYAQLIPFEQDKISVSSTKPLAECEWPELIEDTRSGRTVVYMETSELPKQLNCQETAEVNFEIARQNALAADEAIAAFNALVDKSKVHHQNALNELQRVDDERKRKSLEVFVYQGILVAVLIAVTL